jgi:hypothetical protein
MLAVIHASASIAWQRERLPAMTAGLEALGVQYRVTDSQQRQHDGLAILFGTTLWRAVEAGGPFLLVDRCSFGDTRHYVSLVREGHGRRGDHRVSEGACASRWERHGVLVQPWRQGSRRVLCGQFDTWSPRWRHVRDWYRSVRGATHFRRHPAGDNPTGLPETREWAGAGQAITLNSSVGVESVMAGVPTVTMDEGAMAWAVTSHHPTEQVTPDRTEWLHWLAWTQWHWNEIAEGKPWAHLLP